MKNAIVEKFNQRADAANSILCVGLDSELNLLPGRFQKSQTPQYDFNRWIIDQTAEYTAAFKPNIAFYEARGVQGLNELEQTMQYIRAEYPEIVTICDAKRADIGNTNRGYVEWIFDRMGFDAVTLHPYLGGEALQPFLEREDKASIILCRTSNAGAGEFQDIGANGKPLWHAVAEHVDGKWNTRGNCMLVVGATYPDEMRTVRAVAPDVTFLVPGIGAQGGDVAAVVSAGLDSEGKGLIISASRSILFAIEPAAEACKLRNEINDARSLHASH